jgi:hypothetical protein
MPEGEQPAYFEALFNAVKAHAVGDASEICVSQKSDEAAGSSGKHPTSGDQDDDLRSHPNPRSHLSIRFPQRPSMSLTLQQAIALLASGDPKYTMAEGLSDLVRQVSVATPAEGAGRPVPITIAYSGNVASDGTGPSMID